MRAMLSRCLFGVSLVLFIRPAQANPIDDCNQSPDVATQIDGCSQFLQQEPFSPYVALAYGLRGSAYQKKGDLDHVIADFNHAHAIADYRAALAKNPSEDDRNDLEAALQRLGPGP
jgi:hypothetical protein